jgi:hypothetical protein
VEKLARKLTRKLTPPFLRRLLRDAELVDGDKAFTSLMFIAAQWNYSVCLSANAPRVFVV